MTQRSSVPVAHLNSQHQQALRNIIQEFGPEICEQPLKVQGLLRDFLSPKPGNHNLAINVLVAALKDRIVQELLASRDLRGPMLRQRVATRLQTELALAPEAADWAVDSWGFALGLWPQGSGSPLRGPAAASDDRAPAVPAADPAMLQVASGATAVLVARQPARGRGRWIAGLFVVALVIPVAILGTMQAKTPPAPLAEPAPRPAAAEPLNPAPTPRPEPTASFPEAMKVFDTLLAQRRFQEVVDEAALLIASSPNDAVLYRYRGRGYLGLKQLKEASADFTHALELVPTDAESAAYLAEAHAAADPIVKPRAEPAPQQPAPLNVARDQPPPSDPPQRPPAPTQRPPAPIIRVGDSRELPLPGPTMGQGRSKDVAEIDLQVPADAQVWVEGVMMKQTGTHRTIVSPTLTPGQTYLYDIQVTWTDRGLSVTRHGKVGVRPGEQLGLDLLATNEPAADSEAKLAAQNQIVDRFILFDTGHLPGPEGGVALKEFQGLGADSIPALVRGINIAANLQVSCPFVVFGSKLQGLLSSCNDPDMLTYTLDNLGKGIANPYGGQFPILRSICEQRLRAIAG